MNKDVKEILTAEFNALKNDIIAFYENSGMKASGRWADTVELEVTEMSAKITAADYINGRGPGNPPPIEVIEQWIRDKGLAAKFTRKKSISAVAFKIAQKFGRVGWKPRHGGSARLIKEVVTPERIQEIIDKVGDELLPDFIDEILDYLKQQQ